jgi:hypothetical protein
LLFKKSLDRTTGSKDPMRLPLHQGCGANCEAVLLAGWAREVNLDKGCLNAKGEPWLTRG